MQSALFRPHAALKSTLNMQSEPLSSIHQDARVIARRLRQDQKLCEEQRLPSTLALRLPNPPSPLLDAVAWHLTPHEEVHQDLRLLRCQGVINGIKVYLNELNEVAGEPEDTLRHGQISAPKIDEFDTALRVLEYLQTNDSESSIKSSSSAADVVAAIRGHLSTSSGIRAEYHQAARKASKHRQQSTKRRCYMCRQLISVLQVHDLYPALCRQCGAFNLSSSRLSLPDQLDLSGKTALVTGGRINLGYHTALRLLRCGSRVIVSSRYPSDAAVRYCNEPDFNHWGSRLKVVGADFRTAKDAFQLVHIVKELLRSWDDGQRYLDILVNNAAQTLTDPIKAEMKAISRESHLRDLPQAKALIASGAETSYRARLRGGAQASWIPSIENGAERLRLDEKAHVDSDTVTQKGLRTIVDENGGKSSWCQSLAEFPYEDLISAHSVNAFVPLILCRELLPCMGTDDPKSSSVPAGHIVNVSSREGILEEQSNSASKAGHHVHTNMSKAAINMITETEASSAWAKRRIAMNTVDPGYMSAAPECQRPEGCPIGFEDGAARVLWPVVVAEREGRGIWGRFLKHFEEGTPIIRRGY